MENNSDDITERIRPILSNNNFIKLIERVVKVWHEKNSKELISEILNEKK